MASAFTGQPMSGTAAAIAIAAVMIAYSAAIVSNARLVERRVKRDIVVPLSVNSPSQRATGTACKRPKIQANQKAKVQHHTSLPQVMILTPADHPLQQGLKVMNAANLFLHMLSVVLNSNAMLSTPTC